MKQLKKSKKQIEEQTLNFIKRPTNRKITNQRISREINITMATARNTVKSLEKKGLIERIKINKKATKIILKQKVLKMDYTYIFQEDLKMIIEKTTETDKWILTHGNEVRSWYDADTFIQAWKELQIEENLTIDDFEDFERLSLYEDMTNQEIKEFYCDIGEFFGIDREWINDFLIDNDYDDENEEPTQAEINDAKPEEMGKLGLGI